MARAFALALLLLFVWQPAAAQIAVETLASFDGSNGTGPTGALVLGPDGALYGTTNIGGPNNGGTVFRLVQGGTASVFHALPASAAQTPAGGGGFIASPGLTRLADGRLYGVTNFGGAFGDGTLYRLSFSGDFEVLHSFSRRVDGHQPLGAVQDAAGAIYGTANEGGAFDFGTIWKYEAGSGVTSLHTFADRTGIPAAGLTDGDDGHVYGTGDGIVFRITPAGELSVLHTLAADNSEGRVPWAALTKGRDGHFYGTASTGGLGMNGTIFRISTSGEFLVLHHFAPTSAGLAPEGLRPIGALLEGPDRNFYGTTSAGGLHDGGTLFRISPTGVFTHLYDFPGHHTLPGPPPFGFPNYIGATSPLLLGPDGALYGTTMKGGEHGKGTVYRVNGLGLVVNRPPDCSAATASAVVSPANHRLRPVTIGGVTDPDGDAVTIAVTAVAQDEPASASGDATLAPLAVRASRNGSGDGRVYHVAFSVADGNGGTCTGTVTVCVPHDRRHTACGDGGPLYSSIP